MLLLSTLTVVSGSQVVLATPPASLSVSNPIEYLQYLGPWNECVNETISGAHLSGGPIYLYAFEHTRGDLTLTPANATVSAGGTFTASVNICGHFDVGAVTVYSYQGNAVSDKDFAATTSIQFEPPQETLQAISSDVTIDFGCVTVGVTGQGFVPSVSTPNYVILVPSIGYLPGGTGYSAEVGYDTYLLGITGYRVNVSGQGTLATSFQICGIAPGDVLYISAFDEDAGFYAAPIAFHIQAFS